MALPTFKTKAEIPAGFEDLYEEVGAEWKPKAADTTELDAERTKREAAEKLTKKVAAELETLKTKKKADDAGITDEQLQKIRADVKAEIETELAPIRTERETLAAENRTLKLVNVVKGMAAEAGFLPNRLDDFWKLHGEEFDLGSDGKPVVKGTNPKPMKEHLGAVAKARPEWVQGSKANGGGAITPQPGSGSPDPMALPPEQRLAAAHAAGATE